MKILVCTLSIATLFLLTQTACAPQANNAPEKLPASALNASIVHADIVGAAGLATISFWDEGKQLTQYQALSRLAESADWAFKAMRELAQTIRTLQFDKCGFSIVSHVKLNDENYPFNVLLLKGSPITTPCTADTLLAQPYNSEHAFKDILFNKAGKKRYESAHAIAFSSETNENKKHVIPKGNYLSFYHFANEATKEEIQDFFKVVLRQNEYGIMSGKTSILNRTFAGATYKQEVPHFSWDVEQ